MRQIACLLGRRVEPSFLAVFVKAHSPHRSGSRVLLSGCPGYCIMPAMGKLRIKKKEAVLPFRQTVAYRFMILAFALVVFLIAAYQMVSSLLVGDTNTFIVAAVLAVATAVTAYFNLERMREAKVPKKTLQRMRRR